MNLSRTLEKILIVVPICLLTVFTVFGLPKEYTKKAKKTPDILQTAVSHGGTYCGPAAASNAIVYLAQNGFPRLLTSANTAEEAQKKLINTLASERYMDENNGVGIHKMTSGLCKYVKAQGYKVRRLKVWGWRRPASKYFAGEKMKIKDIKKSVITDNALVLMNVGWYKKEGSDFLRVGGHWITVVGYKCDSILILDPAPRAGREKKIQEVILKRIKRGKLKGENNALPKPAKITFFLTKGFVKKSIADVAVVDSLVFLEIK